jgi:V8-like Glu-specific endopeptidase
MPNYYGSNEYQSDESAAPLMGLNGPERNPFQQQQQQSGDDLDMPGSGGAGYSVPTQARLIITPPRDEAGQYFSEESVGEAPISVGGTESNIEAAEMNEEIGNPEGQEAAEEAFLEATPEQLAASGGESGEEAGEEGLFDVVSGIASSLFETGEAQEVGTVLEAGEGAGTQEEFFPLLAALVPTLISSIGPTVAKQVMKGLSPVARNGVKRLASTVKGAPAKSKPRKKNILGLFAKLLEAAQEKPGGEAAAEVGEETNQIVAEAISTLEVIIGTDDRKRVMNTVGDPWRRICLLRITFPNGQVFRGTGFFVGARSLVTAGHCVYLHSQGGWARKIEVSPGANGTARPYGTAVSTTFRSVRGWVNGKKPECDYGCIVLPAGSFGGRAMGKFGFAAFDGPQLLARAAVLTGYPGDKPMELWGMKRRLKTVTAKTLIYDIDTVGGQSGAPVYLKQNGKRYVVGIHNYGNAAGNSATRVTPLVYQRLKNWSML